MPTTKETKSTLLLPSENTGVAPDGNWKNVDKPTVQMPDDGCINTSECDSPKLPPLVVIVVNPADNVSS